MSAASHILNGQVAIVTGAGRGIGRAIAEAYAAAGAAVGCAARTESELASTVSAIAAQGGRALAVPTDVTQFDSVHAQEADAQRSVLAIDSEWVKTPADVVPMAVFLATQPVQGPTAQSFSLMRREA